VTQAQLHASDPDSPPEQIVYTLTGAPAYGALYKGGARLALGDYFTQADVNSGKVSYGNDGSQNASDGFDLALTNVGPVLEYVSKANDGTPADAMSDHGLSISADSRFVAFSSFASLVPDDSHAFFDVFVRDLLTQTIERVSKGSGGVEANGHSGQPAISADGRWVAFGSEATNLVDGDTNGYLDYFTYDRLTGKTRRVSVGMNGEQVDTSEYPTQPAISADGRFVAFTSKAGSLVPNDNNGVEDVFVFDQVTGRIERISTTPNGSAGDGWSNSPSISADGRHVAFESHASDLVLGSTTPRTDIFIFDRSTRRMEKVNLNPAGQQIYDFAPVLTPDGRFIGFSSDQRRLFPPEFQNVVNGLFIYDRLTGQIKLVGPVSPGVYAYSISADARYAALSYYYSYDDWEVKVVDNLTHQTWQASTNLSGVPCEFVYGGVSISANAALTAFYCSALKVPPDPKTLVGVFAYRGTGPIIHLDVEVELSWMTNYLPEIRR
jgi:Tol biopolymer transport system component